MGYEEKDKNNAEELLDYKYAINQHSIVAVTDQNGSITYVNDKFCELSQYAREELIGNNHRLINSGHHTEEFFQHMYETIHAGKVWKGDIKNKAKDSSFYWVATTITTVNNNEGDITDFIALGNDITDNKRAQAELVAQNIRLLETQKAELDAKEQYQNLSAELKATNEALAKANVLLKKREEELAISNTRFLLAAKSAKVGIWDRDLVNDHSYWDDTLYAIYGITDKSFDINESRVWRTAIHPDDLNDALAALKKALIQEETYVIAYRIIWEDQSIHYLQANAIIQRDTRGKPIRLIGSVIDVTEQKLAEIALRESEEALAISNTRFRLAADAAKVGISDRDLINKNTYWDDLFYALCGITDKSSIDLQDHDSWNKLVHPDDLKHLLEVREKAVQPHQGVLHTEFRVIWEDNSVHYLTSSGIVQRDKNGKALRLISTIMDITDQKMAEEALKKSEEKYKRDNLILEESQSIAKLGGWELDLLKDTLYWTAESYRIHDTSPEEYNPSVERGINYFLGESKNIIHEAIEAAKTTGKGYDLTLEKETTKGRKIYVRTTCKVTLRDGKPVKLSGIIQDITDQKLVEIALRESREKYKRENLLLEQSQTVGKLGGWELDIITGKLYWTAETYRIHETSPEEFDPTVDAGMGYFLPGSKKTISEALEKAMTTGEGYDLYLETYTTKGSRIHVRTTCAVTMHNGQPVKLTGIFQDITEQRKAQQELELSNSRLSIATESAKIGIWEYILDDEGKLIWDDQTFAFYGISRDAFANTYDAWRAAVHPEDLPVTERTLEEAIAEKKVFDKEFRVVWPDKSIHHLRAFANILYDDNDKPLKMIGANYDITEQKNRELKIEEFSTRLSLATDAAKIGIWELIISSGRFIWDEQMLKLHGLTEESFDGSYDGWLSLIHPDDVENQELEMKKHLDEKRDYEGEHRVIWPDKSIHHIRSFGKLVHDKSGQLIKIIGTDYDVTDRVEKEIELFQAKEKAEENDRLKSAFLANMRHEIRNPLNVIMGFSRQMIAPDTKEDDRAEFSSIVINSSQQLLSIIDDITAISLLETKQEHVNKSDVNINDLLSELEKQFTSQAKTRDIKLSLSNSLPNEQSFIATDKSKLTRIITNLLTNALKFTHSGYVKFGYEIKDGELLFFVEDTGIGVAPDHHEQIFGSFQQADGSVNRKYGGTGLGLSISKGLVEILGGKIWFHSQLNKGSKFYVSLPFDQIKSISNISSITGSVGQSNTILIAEDQAINFHYLKVLLNRNFKCEILHALNGEEAVDLFKKNPAITFVLMDINMPVMDGFDAAALIKEIKPDMPIIAQTGYDLESHLKYSPEIFNDYISKPIDEDTFLSKIEVYISKEDYSKKYT